MRKMKEIIKEKSIGIISALVLALLLFVVSYVSSGISDCENLKNENKIIKENISKKLDRTEFLYYQKNTDEKFDNILEMLKEIKQEIKDLR